MGPKSTHLDNSYLPMSPMEAADEEIIRKHRNLSSSEEEDWHCESGEPSTAQIPGPEYTCMCRAGNRIKHTFKDDNPRLEHTSSFSI